MIPELKAKELVDKFEEKQEWNDYDTSESVRKRAKACAIICVDEIIEDHKHNAYLADWKTTLIDYWQQVKEFILNPHP